MDKSIGIKLADGTFYPIMEEGVPSKKKLDLTTVEDFQTTVHVDLFRSTDGTMATAEYVDTLQIENLLPHSSGEPDINLTVTLDEENTLSAEVFESESGSQSDVTVSLVSRDTAALDDAPNFALTDDTPEDTAVPVEELPEIDLPIEDSAAALPDAIWEESTAGDNSPLEDAPDFVFESPEADIEDEIAPAEEVEELAIDEVIDAKNDVSANSFTFGVNPFANDEENDEIDAAAADVHEEVEEVEDDTLFAAMYNDGIEDLPPEDETDDDDGVGIIEEKPAPITVKTIATPPQQGPKNTVAVIICTVCAVICVAVLLILLFFCRSKFFEAKTVCPVANETQNTLETTTVSVPPLQSEPVVKPVEPAIQKPPVDAARNDESAITIIPLPDTTKSQEPIEAPVTIVPAPTPVPEPKPPAPPAPKPVVATPKAPVPTPKPTVKSKAEPIRYKLKWGDTLWDVSQAYYQTPWQYTAIAKYNKIKNPDRVYAGQYILIPPR